MAKGLLLVLLTGLLVAQGPRDLRIEPISRLNPLRDAGTRWAVIVGISSYQNLPPNVQLRFAHRDAAEFSAFLRSTAGGAIPNDHIRILTNEQATLAQIRAALHTWLVGSAGPQDVVYFYFAGHGVLDDRDEGYFVTHDADPQNLHATALPFQEVDTVLSTRLRASLVVMVADACHTGRLGWSSYSPAAPILAGEPLAQIGHGDRSFLKLLASRPSERSYEDEKWDGGHGVFTHILLEGLSGQADADGDRVVRAAEAIDYVSRRVPELTNSQQHPRVAGTFDARWPLASSVLPPPAVRAFTLDVAGPAGSAVYVDNVFRGTIRAAGALRVDGLVRGAHAFSADFPDGSSLNGTVVLPEAPSRVTIAPPAASAMAQLRARVNAGQVLGANGAWELYRTQTFAGADRFAAEALMAGVLEEYGQACVSDYVQSMATGLKRAMLQRAVEAFGRLQTMRPNEPSIEARKLFCQGRMLIEETRFAEAITVLQESLKRDPRFACAYNALGVALTRTNRPKESRQAFEAAAKLTPEWGLPLFQIAQQLVSSGDFASAVPYLERAVAYNPRSVVNRWNLAHILRLSGNAGRAEREAADLIRLNPDYPPAYLVLGQARETLGKPLAAAEAYDAYVLLAPNYAGTEEVRARATRLRARSRPVPSLRR
ncbi:MAG TPA: tetratricopeptide repeat protein [Bryobacteraceae bacterium]|nr:tetratricopeptide repeat protein [Bryobacteraceae bacterium]